MPLSTQAAMQKDKASAGFCKMEHRHFALIAGVIANMTDANSRYETAYLFGLSLRKTNPSFDHDRFMRACNAIKVAC